MPDARLDQHVLAAPLWLHRARGYSLLNIHTWMSNYKPVPLPFTLHLPIPMITNAAAPLSNPSDVSPNATRYRKNASGKLSTMEMIPQNVSQMDRDVRMYIRMAMAAREKIASCTSLQKIDSTW